MVLSKIFLIFTPNLGEMIQFDEHLFQMGWFNFQLESLCETDYVLESCVGDYDFCAFGRF